MSAPNVLTNDNRACIADIARALDTQPQRAVVAFSVIDDEIGRCLTAISTGSVHGTMFLGRIAPEIDVPTLIIAAAAYLVELSTPAAIATRALGTRVAAAMAVSHAIDEYGRRRTQLALDLLATARACGVAGASAWGDLPIAQQAAWFDFADRVARRQVLDDAKGLLVARDERDRARTIKDHLDVVAPRD